MSSKFACLDLIFVHHIADIILGNKDLNHVVGPSQEEQQHQGKDILLYYLVVDKANRRNKV